MSIYLGDTKVTGTGVQIDDTLSSDSQHAVTNAAITNALVDVGYSEWQKPADWVDIRSGALDNSVYYLVAHSTPVENSGTYTVADYAKWSINATVTTAANTYDVYVDGIKVATTASNTATTLDWGALITAGTVTSGMPVQTPSALSTHVVQITPTVSTDKIEKILQVNITGQVMQGTLWVHFEIDNFINTRALLGASNTSTQNRMCKAITAKNDELKVKVTESNSTSGLAYFSMGLDNTASNNTLQHLPTIVGNNNLLTDLYAYSFASRFTPAIKKLRLKNLPIGYNGLVGFRGEEIITDTPIKMSTGTTTDVSFGTTSNGYLHNLKRFPTSTFKDIGRTAFVAESLSSLEPTALTFSPMEIMTKLSLAGTSSYPSYGIKSVVVSNAAPFDGASPQINLNYTGLDRAALINLFKSLPYAVSYTVIGSDVSVTSSGVASGFSNSSYIASNKNVPTNTQEKLELYAKFTVGTLDSTNQGILMFASGPDSGAGYNSGLMITSSNKLVYKVARYTGTQQNFNIVSSVTLTAGQTYIARGYYVGEDVYAIDVSADNGSTWTTDTDTKASSGTIQVNTDYPFTIGHSKQTESYQYPFNGSIDLPNTYVKYDGKPWFTGLLHTCSIVGATGTADLTATDKAIAEDKGWALTLS